MITQNNIQYRNLEEQVRKNTELLNFIPMGLAGADFLGILDNDPDISNNLRKTYLKQVATDKFHLFFIDPIKGIVDLGAFPAEGPQGEPGIAIPSPGPQGEQGVGWLIGSTNFPSTLIDGSPLVDGTLFLNTTTYDVYRYRTSTNNWYGIGNLRGGVGPKGDRGAQGEQGIQGEQGEQGPVGKSGASYAIQGIVASSEELRNVPIGAVSYLVGTAAPYQLWMPLNGQWTNVGTFPYISENSEVLNTVYGTSTEFAPSQVATNDAIIRVAPNNYAATNIANPDEFVSGELIYSGPLPTVSGYLSANESFMTTGYIPVEKGVSYRIPRLNTNIGTSNIINRIPYYSARGQAAAVGFIDNDATLSSSVSYLTYPSHYRWMVFTPVQDGFIRVTFEAVDSSLFMVIKGNSGTLPAAYITPFAPQLVSSSDLTTVTVNDNTKYIVKNGAYANDKRFLGAQFSFIGDDFMLPYYQELTDTAAATLGVLNMRTNGCLLSGLQDILLSQLGNSGSKVYRFISCGFDEFFQPSSGAGPRIRSNTYTMGEYTPQIYGPSTRTTIYEWLDRVCYLATNTTYAMNQNGVRNIWVIPHRMFNDNDMGLPNNNVTWAEFKEAIKKTCKKWGIQVIDIEENFPPVSGGLTTTASYYPANYVSGDKYSLIALKDLYYRLTIPYILNNI